MSKDLFKRIEKKYILNQKQLQDILKDLEERYFLIGPCKKYLLQNIYFDTYDDQLMIRSINKPAFKEKIRLRAYNLVDMESYVFLEIKKKYKGIVYKSRSQMTLLEAYYLIHTQELPEIKNYHNLMVLKEIQQFVQKYVLEEKTYVGYERHAFEKDGLRITIDENILTRHDKLRLEFGYCGSPLLEQNEGIMEIKTTDAIPIWLSQILLEHGIFPDSFSKVGTDFIQSKQSVTRKKEKKYVEQHY
ncbi:MAG: polyphosphate polymerase domain-containing protein [Clostridia bacterium]|nr:polyphosphate polymerase domain-containing protein [Clostridia bacterium]